MGSKNQTSSTSGTSNGTSTTTLSPQVQAAYNALLGQIGGSASGTNSATNAATSGLGSLASGANPNFGAAAGTLAGAANPASASISDYLSPYLTGALQTQIASQNQQNGQQQQGVIGNAIAQGALGGNRVAVAQSQLAGQQALANNQANSSLINSAYTQAANQALQGQSNETAAGTAQGNLGATQTNASLSSLLGLLSAGNSQYGNLGTLAGSASGLSNDGATTTSSGTTSGTATTPGPSLLSQILGVATTAAGFFPKANGGVVRGYDGGGIVAEQALERANGAQSAEDNSATAIQALQQMMQQQSQQNQTPAPTDEQKQGMANIKGWLFPASGAAPDASGHNTYRSGGVVPRAYGPGGVVDPSSSAGFDLGGFLSSLLTPPASNDNVTPDQKSLLDKITSNDNTPPAPKPMPMAVNSGVIPAPQTADAVASIAPASVPVTPRLSTGNVVPMMRAPAAAPSVVVPATAPVPLAPLPASSGVIPNNTRPSGLNLGSAANAIRSIESGSPAGDYSSVGPATRTGDRAYGAYQVMGANIPSWTAQYYGKSLTPAEFLNNPEAQDAVFKGQFSSYANDYGPQGAAQAWFAGPKGMNNPNAADSNGTTVGGYGQRFSSLYGNSPAAPNSSPQGVLASDMGFGRPAAPNPANGPVIADNGVGYNPSKQDSPNIGGVISSLMSGHGTGLSDNMRAALMSAGFGMMAGTSPFPLVNVGTGGQAGLKTYQDLQEQNRQQVTSQADVAQRAAEATRTKVATANEATTYAPAGIGMIRKTVNPDGSVTMTRVPYSSIPVAGGDPGQGGPGSSAVAPAGTDPNGFVLTAPDVSAELPGFANTDAGAAQLQTQGKAYTEPAQADAMAAHKLDVSLAQLSSLADSLPDSGALTQGAGFGSRTALANSINTAFGILGIQPVIDPAKVSTAEDVNKLGTQLQAAVATSWKTDPAASTIMQAGTASPSGENTKQGFKRIVANIQAVNKRAVDRAAFLTSWQNQNFGVMSTANGQTADDVFNQLNPPSKYVDYGEKLAVAVTPKTQADIDRAPKGTVFNINGTLMVK